RGYQLRADLTPHLQACKPRMAQNVAYGQQVRQFHAPACGPLSIHLIDQGKMPALRKPAISAEMAVLASESIVAPPVGAVMADGTCQPPE
ncbi:hypothetical protein ACQUFD_17355, partial [Enterococcus gallinarum]|uniref:hypothetical protein n=1 Tax=Enterococcus gallinarum TaxID=1353 RepID=UPI003D108D16